MYKIKKENFNKYSRITHEQKYFVYKWSDLLDYKTFELQRIPLIGLKGLFQELLSVYKLTNRGIIKKVHYEKLTSEIKENMKNNKILKEEYRPEYFVILNYLEYAYKDVVDIEEFPDIISAFFNKLNKDYFEYIIDYLICELRKADPLYCVIDRLTQQLLTDLIYQGYSVSYLYNWGLENFVYGDDPDFFNRLKKLVKLGEKEEKVYNCLFILKPPEKLLELDANANIDFIKNKEKFNINNDEIPELRSSTQRYALIKEKAIDIYSAMNKADLRLNNLLKLFKIKSFKYEPNIKNEIIIYYKEKVWKKNRGNKILNIEIGDNLLAFIETYVEPEKSKYNSKTIETLNRTLHWCRIANESPLESKFLSLWTALEFLLTGHGDNKISSILNYLPCFIGTYFPRRFIREIWFESKSYTDNLSEEQISKLQLKKIAVTDSELNKIKEEEFLNLLLEGEEKFIDNFIDNDLIVRNLRWLQDSLNEKKLFLKELKKLEQQIRNDLRRMYRLRNRLTHQAYINTGDLFMYTKRLSFYLNKILTNMLYLFQNNFHHTPYQLLVAQKEQYNNLIESLEEHNYPELSSEVLIFPPTVFSN